MTFTTSLESAISSASTLAVDGYEVDDIQHEEFILIGIPDGNDTSFSFSPSIVVAIGADGDAVVLDVDGFPHDFIFMVSRPMAAADIAA